MAISANIVKPNKTQGETTMKANEEEMFFRKTLIIFAVAALVGLLWFLSNIIILVFGAVLLSIILHAISHPIHKNTGMPQRYALFISILVIISAFLIVSWMMGSIVASQVEDLSQRIPAAWETFKGKVSQYSYGRKILRQISNYEGQGVTSGLSTAAFSVVDGIANFLVVLVGGVFIAAQPTLYKEGFLKLIPKGKREQVGEALNLTGRALRLWFLGKLISMLCIGIMVSVVFLSMGLPSAIALGLMAGIGEFVPYIGSLIAIFPALLLASSQSWELVLWVLGAFIIIQQIQGNLVTPLVQQRMVSLPPALTIFSLVTFAVLFGPIGVLFAEPLTVTFFVMTKKLYVRDTLGEKTFIPGEKSQKK
jgi:predicted PurR-regulated permease PerM